MRLVVLRRHYEAGCVAVKTVDDTRPECPAERREPKPSADERVDERTRASAGRRVDDHTYRLVDHNDIVVFEDDVERDVLGAGRQMLELDRKSVV